jgi:hypothetical protein
MKWISWAKKHRRVLSSEFVTMLHGTVCLGLYPIATSQHSSTKCFIPVFLSYSIVVVLK